MTGEARRKELAGEKVDPRAYGASEKEEPKPVRFVVKTEGKRVIFAFEREINFLDLPWKDAIAVGRALIKAGQDVRTRRHDAPPPPEA